LEWISCHRLKIAWWLNAVIKTFGKREFEKVKNAKLDMRRGTMAGMNRYDRYGRIH
jgi:hypothetical protein